jgi:hypothetical protein
LRCAGAVAASWSSGQYGKYFRQNVIFLTLGVGWNRLVSPRDQHISNHSGRDRPIDTI